MKPLLRQNSDLRRDGIWNWTLPAWVTKLPDGRVVNVCPSAGACKDLCYARTGTYLFRNVREAHNRNLALTLDDLEGWKDQMLEELNRKKFRPSGDPRFPDDRDRLVLDDWTREWMDAGGSAVRVHDSGDFYSDEYLDGWIEIAREVEDVLFYAYTKEVPRVKARARAGDFPPNFRIILSLGGIHDHLIDGEEDRHAEVFPDLVSLADAGYEDQTESDLYSVLLDTTKVGIPANNIRHFRRRQGDRTFGEIERDKGRRRAVA
jgi:hypothetical protein